MNKPQIILAKHLGFCGGVRRAMQCFDEALQELGAPVYVLHELVHNRSVSEEMVARGAIFIHAPEELPPGANVLIGAHGISPQVEESLRCRAGKVVDATCPIVKQAQAAAADLADNENLVFLGVKGHPEAEGILGRVTKKYYLVTSPEDVDNLPEIDHPVFLSQTTINYRDADVVATKLRAINRNTRELGTVCKASLERQTAVEELVASVDALLVIGSPHSSNANRLRDIGIQAGIPAWLIEGPDTIPNEAKSVKRLGVTAAASTPPNQIQNTLDALR